MFFLCTNGGVGGRFVKGTNESDRDHTGRHVHVRSIIRHKDASAELHEGIVYTSKSVAKAVRQLGCDAGKTSFEGIGGARVDPK